MNQGTAGAASVHSFRGMAFLAAAILACACFLLTGTVPAEAAPPANDNFANAQSLVGDPATVAGTTVDAGHQAGERNHWDSDGQASVWYSWTATASKTATADACDTESYFAAVVVYTGNSLNGLTRVGVGDCAAAFEAVSGTTYRIVVDSYRSSAAPFNLTVRTLDPPANDDFADAIQIDGTPATVNGTTAGATHEAGEPDHQYMEGDASVWYSWTAPQSGTALLDACGNGYRVVALAAYSGTEIDDLAEVGGGYCRTAFPVTGGQTYRIAVDSYRGNWGAFVLDVSVHQPPANDGFANAQTLSGSPASATGTLLGATSEAGEPDYYDIDDPISVWYSWTAPSSGNAMINACEGGGYVSGIGAYTGSSIGSLQEKAVGYCSVGFPAQAGVTYKIAVVGYGNWPGPFGLEAGIYQAPANDDFAAAQVLTGSTVSASGTTLGAGHQASEPTHYEGYGDASVWYAWTAPQSGTAMFSTCEDDRWHVEGVAAYTGSSLNNLTERGSGYCSMSFTATAGTTYYLAVDSYGFGGPFELTLQLIQPPANDNFANAQTLTGNSASVSGSNLGATRQVNEPEHWAGSGNESVWYRWTAPQSGTVTIDTCGTNSFDTVLSVYTGTSLSNLETVGGDDDGCDIVGSQVELEVSAGTTYYVAVTVYGSEGGPFTLNLDLVPDSGPTAGKPEQAPQIVGAPAVSTPETTFQFTEGAGETQEVTGFECRLDGAQYEPCTSPKGYAGLAGGAHSFGVRAVNSQGAGPEATHSWTVESDGGKPGSPALGALKVKPKSKTVKRGKKVTISVTVRNGGTAAATGVKVCAKAPAKLVKVKKCVTVGSLAAGKSRVVKFKATVKKKAKKGKKAKLTFTATANGVAKKTAKVTLKTK